ncbi:kelch repeat and BTB domain-containing protein 7 isoform X1 [Antennarius striatus]|uniref:kelch repeat and BTB domain-containing protein 7 isoform X1 n=1 Tax=Antennarius striatus TaxID=241820 RepID=UPI0035AE87F8
MASVLGYFSGPEVLEDVDHARGLIKELKCLYDCHLLGDVTVGVEDEEECPEAESTGGDIGQLFLCSRNILAAASPYFRSMFTGGLHESVQETVLIRGVDAESMSVIIHYCYTGMVTITESSVQRLYAAANMLQFEYIMKACASFMTRRLDLSNCVVVLKFADTYGNVELKENAQAFIARNFSQVCSRGSLCELDLMQLNELLSLNTLDVDCERKVCSAALQWIEANALQKKDDALQVLKCVRWSLFAEKDKSYLESLMFWLYDPVRNIWQELAERPLGRIHCGIGYLNGHVFLLGGRHPATDARLKEVECYSVQRNQWTFVAPLPHSLGKMQVLALNDHLYVVNRRRMLCYDPKRNRWRHCGSLRRNKLHKACVFQDQIIFVCDIPVVKAYNPTRGEWRRLGDIPINSCSLNYQVIQHNNNLLLLIQTLLQYNKNQVFVYAYDPARDTWKRVMAEIVSTLGPVCVSTRVYPACLGSAHSFSTEEEDDSGSSADWDFDGLTDVDSDSGSSSSFSD